ncbi:MAG: DPP IV N-terminal domain-containing protein [Bacteroidaceae bacterium]|nr:DPP IV N-terminal domain-containing protein [Bacteroidaceae bacterium]
MTASITAMAQQHSPNKAAPTTDDRLFTEEQVFSSGEEYKNFSIENKVLTWWGDELIRLDRQECFTVNKKTGKETLLFSNEQLTSWLAPDITFKQQSLRSITFPCPDKPLVLLLSGQGVALFNFKTHAIEWKHNGAGYAAHRLATKTNNYAYIKEGNLYVNSDKLTTDGDDDAIVYGQAVHRNEWGIEDGLFWSPDGNSLAFYRMDQSMVQNHPLPSYLQGDRVKDTKTRYPMAGDTSHKVTIGVYNTASKKLTYLDCGDPTDRFFTNIQWSPDSKTIYLFELNREQNKTKLDAYSAGTGKFFNTLYREESAKYVEPLVPIQFLPWNDKQFVIQTRRDGYNHLYLYDTTGKLIRQLTKGEFEVTDMIGFCKDDKRIIFKSREASPIHNNLYNVYADNGKRYRMDNGYGVHGASYGKILSSSGKYLIDTWSSHNTPRCIDLVNTSEAAQKKPTAVSLLKAADPWKDKHQPIFEAGSIKAADGKTDLYYRIVKPYNFDETKKYPAVIYVYGGPHARNVDDRWHYTSRPWETIMSQKGYIVFILDNRGSSERGLEFEQATWHQLGKVEMEDQMKGVEYLKSLPYIDGNRLGVHGWSFGGFMTCSLMTTYPDVFKVGVAGGPVIDWKWYEVMYGERYMGTPQNNPDGYKNSSLLYKAGNLKGRLLVITGMSDPTVVPQNCLNFLNAAEQAGKQVDFYAYPDEGHNMAGHKQVTLHKRITQYFEDFLK